MRYWEFLIQQEGDQTWLPLETRQVEILEGRYRMAAHTSYDDTAVEVRVSQLLLDEMPPRRRVRKRKTMTNDSGLLAVFPFMQLSPGRWEIDCNSPDVIDDFLGESWHYSVQLQVTPRDEEDWDPDWSDTSTGQGADRAAIASMDASTSTLTTEDIAPEVQLQLKQQAYVTQPGQPLALVGSLTQPGVGQRWGGQLQVELRDPQTASTLQEKAFDVSVQPQPSTFFSVTVTVPEELSTQVILGAISLVTPTGEAVSSASFTITMGLAQMLDAIANQPDLEFEEEISIFPGTTEAFVPPSEKSETLLTQETPIIPKELIPSEGLTLPPQIKPPSEPDLDRQPVLPEFSAAARARDAGPPSEAPQAPKPEAPTESPQSPEPEVPAVAPPVELPAALPAELPVERPPEPPVPQAERREIEAELPAEPPLAEPPVEALEPEEYLAFSEPKVFEQGSLKDDELDLEVVRAAQADERFLGAVETEIETAEPGWPATAPAADSEAIYEADSEDIYEHDTETPDRQWQPATDRTDQAFQDLRLQDRFWQKLSQFTQDGYRQSLEVQRALKLSDSLPEGNRQSNEFVVEDPRPQRRRPQTMAPASQTDEPVQVLPPMLDVPMQELVAGEWIAIKVRVPPAETYQPYVKVWMNDLQTRTVIDAPRLLMQFTPNEANELETLMRVKVPSGCLELQFAAIAVDTTTLQESRKVVQNRRVMPPDTSLSMFDDWDM